MLFRSVLPSVYFVTLVILQVRLYLSFLRQSRSVTYSELQFGNLLSVRNSRMSILQADPFRKAPRNFWVSPPFPFPDPSPSLPSPSLPLTRTLHSSSSVWSSRSPSPSS